MKILYFDLDQYQALLFDLDGTLINSMPLHNKAWLETLKDHGADVDIQFLLDTAGMSSLRIVSILNEQLGKSLDPVAVSRDKRDRYLMHLDEVKTVPALMEIVEEYYQKLPMGIITGGSHEVVDMLLPKLGIDHYFDCVVCSDDTKRGKDSVGPYQLAAQLLKVDVKKALFFDDGDVGLKGAMLAGMDVIHVDVNSEHIFSIPK